MKGSLIKNLTLLAVLASSTLSVSAVSPDSVQTQGGDIKVGLLAKRHLTYYRGPGDGDRPFSSILRTDNVNANKALGVLDNITVSGVIRFLTIYRNMDISYDDMITSDRNFSFSDYPLASVGNNVNGGFPHMELNFTTKVSPNFLLNAGYSFAWVMSGADAQVQRIASSRQNLFVNGKINAGRFRFDVSGGGLLWQSLSKFTMGQPEYRDSYFNRMPWDWYRNSYLRYEEYFTLARNLGAEGAGRSPILGFIFKSEYLPTRTKVTFLMGRTNTNVGVGQAVAHYPSITYAGRVEQMIWTRYVGGKVGFNFHLKNTDDNIKNQARDDQHMYTLDYKLKVKKVTFSGEFGTNYLTNRYSTDAPTVAAPDFQTTTRQGYGVDFKVEIDRDASAFPISLELYNIDINMVSHDGAILNTNMSSRAGLADYLYDQFLHVGMMQEVGQIANNRRGVIFRSERSITSKFKVELGLQVSQEIENFYDTITFQHRVNAFSRSRFRPWFNAGGNYGRIKSNWMRTFETMTITDDPAEDYKKTFTAIEWMLKYKAVFLNRDIVLLNYNSLNASQAGKMFDAERRLVSVFYEDFTAAWKVTKRVALVGNFGIEWATGGNMTQKNLNTQKAIDQMGTSFAVGIDYDFAKNAGLHLRQIWMNHQDNNWALDRFKGTETNFELKYFF
jgi:hypothetical protein